MKRKMFAFVAGIAFAFGLQMTVFQKGISPIDFVRYQYECASISSYEELPVSYLCKPGGIITIVINGGRAMTPDEWKRYQETGIIEPVITEL